MDLAVAHGCGVASSVAWAAAPFYRDAIYYGTL